MVRARRPAARRAVLVPAAVAVLAASAPARAQEYFRLPASPDSITVRRGTTVTITVKIEPASGATGVTGVDHGDSQSIAVRVTVK
jgi:hypothetical protein